MKRSSVIFVIYSVFAASAAWSIVSYGTVFKKAYDIGPDSRLGKAKCALCHVTMTDEKLNPYGRDIEKALKRKKTTTLTKAILSEVENLDSDKDGKTNIAEIKADTLPGDGEN